MELRVLVLLCCMLCPVSCSSLSRTKLHDDFVKVVDAATKLNEATKTLNPFSPITTGILGVLSLIAGVATKSAVKHRKIARKQEEQLRARGPQPEK